MAAIIKEALEAKRATTALNVLRRKQLEAKLGLSRSAIYARNDPKSAQFDPTFPKPIELGKGKNPPIGWFEHEVDAYLVDLALNSRAK